MGFQLQWIGRPSTPYGFMTAIKNVLVSAGWSVVYDDGSSRIVVRTASYLGTNGPVIDFTVNSTHVEIQGHHDWNTTNNQPITPSTPKRRMRYGHQTSEYYWVYANEYWFMTINADSLANWGSSQGREVGGVVLPPQGITTPPPYHPVFIYGNYDTAGTGESNGIQYLAYTGGVNYNCPWFIHPQTGGSVRTNFIENLGNYSGIPSQPATVFPPFVNGGFGELPYALISASSGAPFSFTGGNEKYVSVFWYYAGIYARVS